MDSLEENGVLRLPFLIWPYGVACCHGHEEQAAPPTLAIHVRFEISAYVHVKTALAGGRHVSEVLYWGVIEGLGVLACRDGSHHQLMTRVATGGIDVDEPCGWVVASDKDDPRGVCLSESEALLEQLVPVVDTKGGT